MQAGRGAKWGRVVKPWLSVGYLYVGLWRGNRQTKIAVHRLVALAFLAKPARGQYQVAHCNGRRSDNRPENLRWATARENAADRNGHGTGFQGEFNPAAKLKQADVVEIRRMRAGGAKYQEIADRFKIDRRNASFVARGLGWAHVS